MENVDIILCWPKHLDYPLWRDFIKEHGKLFNKVIIAFTETNQPDDYTDFIMEDLGEDNFIYLFPETPGGEDWRNHATNMALAESNGEWVWFTEQDLFILNADFWLAIRTAMINGYDAMGYMDGGTRMHPCNLWVKREWINKTGRDFGIVPDKLDHFARFYTQLRLSGAKIFKIDYNTSGNGSFYHMNGLSHNLTLVRNKEEVTYKEEEFATYIYMSLNAQTVNDGYRKLYEKYWDDYVKRTTEAA